MAARKKLSPAQAGILHGFRSGLEEAVANQMRRLGVTVEYEVLKVGYIKPARKAKYTPDFALPNGIVIETKGRFLTEDRQKHLLVKEQHPKLDIRFVFSNSNAKISKGSRTTYAAWCTKHGFMYADRLVPVEWVNEPPNPERMEALASLNT